LVEEVASASDENNVNKKNKGTARHGRIRRADYKPEREFVVELELDIRRLIEQAAAPGRNCARNAIRHVDRAEQLRVLDPEMCYFRLITAEEEAASAVFHSLKRRRYIGAERLSPTKHTHKMALRPFILAVRALVFMAGSFVGVEVVPELDPDDRNHFRTRIRIPGSEEFVSDPPLDLNLYSDGKLHDYAWELGVVTKHHGHESVLKYVRDEAAQRRKLLYAGTEGMWAMTEELDEGFYQSRRRIVLGHLLLFLMIDPHPKRQLFVQQCLESLLKVLELLPSDDALLDGQKS
jgi:hypothetical protein